ncbi:hypothetical protein [Fundidesulfovibrio putealis]|uniref:hypothetical protein n=1 Tax=Fundidesulfovibrio putealis TaxID=270496 RepID=UPI0004201424|nr:hypothetical protein [Fundidesulfovibrio putealis]
MSVSVKRIVLRTPAAVGSLGQFSALDRCRDYAADTADALLAAQASQTLAQGAANVAVAARDVALAAAGGVKVTAADAVISDLDTSLSVAAPLEKSVLSPGGDERLRLSVSEMAPAGPEQSGAPGVVPAPQAGDDRKYLRGDATWQTLDRNTVGMANVEDTWTLLPGEVSMVSATQAALPGDCLALALPGGSPGRAVRPDEPQGATGFVAAAVYDAANTRTLITVEGFAFTPQCTRLQLGQDPRNAPSASSAGSDLYLANIFNYLSY